MMREKERHYPPNHIQIWNPFIHIKSKSKVLQVLWRKLFFFPPKASRYHILVQWLIFFSCWRKELMCVECAKKILLIVWWRRKCVKMLLRIHSSLFCGDQKCIMWDEISPSVYSEYIYEYPRKQKLMYI